jgi:hypothetical protein
MKHECILVMRKECSSSTAVFVFVYDHKIPCLSETWTPSGADRSSSPLNYLQPRHRLTDFLYFPDCRLRLLLTPCGRFYSTQQELPTWFAVTHYTKTHLFIRVFKFIDKYI